MGFVIFKPVHLLFINLITDSIPAVALGMEPAQPGIMERPPRGRKDGIFSGGLGVDVIYQGILIAALTLSAYFIVDGWHSHINPALSHDFAMTSAFFTLSLSEILHSFNMRSRRQNIFTLKTHNKLLWGAMVLSLVLTLLTIYVPPLARMFSLQPLTSFELIISFILSVSGMLTVEMVKVFQRAYAKHKGKDVPC